MNLKDPLPNTGRRLRRVRNKSSSMARRDSSVLMLMNVVRTITILLFFSFSDIPSSVVKLPIFNIIYYRLPADRCIGWLGVSYVAAPASQL